MLPSGHVMLEIVGEGRPRQAKHTYALDGLLRTVSVGLVSCDIGSGCDNCRYPISLNSELQLAMKILNILGLFLVTIGALGAGICAPGPSYMRDGSVQLGPAGKSGPEFKTYRVRKHYMQKYGLPFSLWMVGFGSALQMFVAIADAAAGD